jgi:hypothetical protein
MATVPGFPFTDENNEACNIEGCPNKHADEVGLCETHYLTSIEQHGAYVRHENGVGFKEGQYKTGDLFDQITFLAKRITAGDFSRKNGLDLMDEMKMVVDRAQFSSTSFYWIAKLRKAHPVTVLSGTDADLDPNQPLLRK